MMEQAAEMCNEGQSYIWLSLAFVKLVTQCKVRYRFYHYYSIKINGVKIGQLLQRTSNLFHLNVARSHNWYYFKYSCCNWCKFASRKLGWDLGRYQETVDRSAYIYLKNKSVMCLVITSPAVPYPYCQHHCLTLPTYLLHISPTYLLLKPLTLFCHQLRFANSNTILITPFWGRPN